MIQFVLMNHAQYQVFQQHRRAESSVSSTIERMEGGSEKVDQQGLWYLKENNQVRTSNISRANRKNGNVLPFP